MTFRTIGSLVGAANAARDLTNLVVAYLNLWRQHANGMNGVTIPDENYTVVFQPPREDALAFTVAWTRTVTWTTPTYYDVDDDYFVESYSPTANISGEETHSELRVEERNFIIPYSALLRSEADMKAHVLATAARIRAQEAEAERQREIAALQAKLADLQKAGQ